MRIFASLFATPSVLLLPAAFAMAVAPGLAQGLPANGVIPQPPPSAPLSQWTDAPDRFRVKIEVGGVALRGWDYKPGPRGEARDDARLQKGRNGTLLGKVESAMGATHNAAGEAAEKDVPLILFFNGNIMEIAEADTLYRQMTRTGAEVVVYDYRGYGFSEGTADIEAFRKDALAEYDETVRAYPGRRVIVYGYSLGTAIAAHVAAERKVGGLVLTSAFASAAEELPLFAIRLGISPEVARSLKPDSGAQVAFDEVAMVRQAGQHNSGAPLLMLHGRDDSLVPVAQGREVFEASPAKKKQFVVIPGADHRETISAAASFRALGAFLARR